MPAPKGNQYAKGCKTNGRPTKYKKKYCQMLINHMSEGLGFKSFAAVIDVNEDTLYEWNNRYKDFSDAKKIAFSKNRLFWERAGAGGMLGKIAGFNATVWIFSMKNRFGWGDKTFIETKQNVKVTTKNYDELSKEELRESIDEVLS